MKHAEHNTAVFCSDAVGLFPIISASAAYAQTD